MYSQCKGFVYITRLYNGSVISRAREAEFSLVQVTNKDTTKTTTVLFFRDT